MLERKKTLNVFHEAKNVWGSWDDYPVGPKGTDPMPHLSRGRVPQPFFLVSEEDQVLIQMAGEAELLLRETDVAAMSLVPGDSVYVPAGVATRVVPRGEVLLIRLKAEPTPREIVAWYCDACGAVVSSREIEGGVVQDQYWAAATAFNADERARTCGCGKVHPPVDLGDIHWPEVAASIRADE